LETARIDYIEIGMAPESCEAVKYTQPQITGLVASAAGGDFEAFGKLYRFFIERIYRYVFYQVMDKMTAEDITADVFVKALKNIQSCKGKEATFSAWLYRIACNLTIDYFRHSKKDLTVEVVRASNLEEPVQETGGHPEREELLEAISRLPQHQRHFITLKFIEGMDNRQIGRIMGKSQVAMRLLQFRAITALKKEFGRG
jgi:RNA polymerase sigma-70 factor (ECF subfamily)